MNRMFVTVMLWTLLLSIPMAVVSILAIGVLTINGIDLFSALGAWVAGGLQTWRINWAEIMTRMPEVVGMAAGMLVILITVVVARQAETANGHVSQRK